MCYCDVVFDWGSCRLSEWRSSWCHSHMRSPNGSLTNWGCFEVFGVLREIWVQYMVCLQSIGLLNIHIYLHNIHIYSTCRGVKEYICCSIFMDYICGYDLARYLCVVTCVNICMRACVDFCNYDGNCMVHLFLCVSVLCYYTDDLYIIYVK